MSGRGKVLVAMSGGVDSSVAAALLLREGYDVVGCFMRLGSPGDRLDEPTPADAGACDRPGTGVKIGHQGCCSVGDAADARLVAAQLGVPFYVCNFKKDFARIIYYFVDEYAAGRTPNPCVRCNDWLKFGKLHEYARQLGAQWVASGHYARIGLSPGGADAGPGSGYRLLRGVDLSKDQSYVLFGVPRAQLAHTLFPIGGLPKSRVRALAQELGLPVFDKPDSQEICFVPDNDYAGLVERRRPAMAHEGAVVDEAGRRLGTHGGHHRFTIGQRRGVGIAASVPLFVLSKDPGTNTLVVGPRERLAVHRLVAQEANWLVEPPDVGKAVRCLAKYRYNSEPVRACVTVMHEVSPDTPSGRVGAFEVAFDDPQFAVASGQAVVLYDAAEPDVVLGGGWVQSTAG